MGEKVMPFPDGAEKIQYVVKGPPPWERKGDVVKAMEEERGEVPMLNNAKVKKARYHVDLSEEMGKDLTEIADKMGLSLSAVVKLMLMQNWMKYRVNGFDYLYLGVADMPAKIGEIPY